nr:hypothetical protein [Brachybacterium sillae]
MQIAERGTVGMWSWSISGRHTEAELAGLMEAGREKINAGQGVLDLGTATSTSPATITSKQSRLLLETLQSAWAALGSRRSVMRHSSSSSPHA